MNNIVSRELGRVSRAEKELRRLAYRENMKWKTVLQAKVPKKVLEALRSVFGRAFEAVFDKGTGIIEATYRKEELRKDFLVRDYALDIDSRKHYFRLNARSGLNSVITLLASTAEGVGLGALGIGMPDIVLFTSVILRDCYETALRYGFEYDAPEEKIFILTLLEASLQRREDWDLANDRVDRMMQSPHTPSDEEIKAQIRRTADAFAVDMLTAKFIQGIPVIGIVGGLANPLYYKKVHRYVNLKYKMRYLLTKDISKKVPNRTERVKSI